MEASAVGGIAVLVVGALFMALAIFQPENSCIVTVLKARAGCIKPEHRRSFIMTYSFIMMIFGVLLIVGVIGKKDQEEE
ncbi:hypothetical protein HJC23_009519 [Cyclotella cryptica]|uniref:Uncharacterized protein n=1 Tax=Cyclotella cryptica TaxID=29204 RepID=A0ABD3Q723_9STRA